MEELREYIRERIDYTEERQLVSQVCNLLRDFETQIRWYFYPYSCDFPSDIERFIEYYNVTVDDLKRNRPEESRKYSHIDIDDFHLERWTLNGNEVQMEFQKYNDRLEEMKRLLH